MGLEHGQAAYTLQTLRAAMTRLHEAGSIYYDRDRLDAYCIMARIASDYRQELIRRHA